MEKIYETSTELTKAMLEELEGLETTIVDARKAAVSMRKAIFQIKLNEASFLMKWYWRRKIRSLINGCDHNFKVIYVCYMDSYKHSKCTICDKEIWTDF